MYCGRSCTDLGDNDMEVVIVRGLNYNLPSGTLCFILALPVVLQKLRTSFVNKHF